MTTKKKLTKKQRRKRKIILFAVEISVLLLLLLGLFIKSKLDLVDRTKIDKKDLKINELDETTKELLKGFTNVAIFGLDNRSNGSWSAGNSDVIMIASINNDTKEVKLVSIYRDTYLDVGEKVFKKINAAYGRGGATNAIATLNSSFDLDISEYVVVDFNAVTDAIDLLGGVEITVQPEEVIYLNHYAQTTAEVTGKTAKTISGAGTYLLDGTQATGYARIRYTAGDDYRRTERQRTVVEQMVKNAKASDLSTLNKIVDAVCDDISTSMSNSTILGLVASALDYELIGTNGFPFELANKKMGGKVGDVVVATDLATNVSELHEYLFGVKDYVPSATVKAYSQQIISDTGLGASDTARWDNPLEKEESTETETEQ